MAGIMRRKRRDGGTSYTVRWLDPNGAWQSRTFRKLKDAQAFGKKVDTEVDQGTYIDPEHGKRTLNEVIEQYISKKDGIRAAKTIEGYRTIHRAHIETTVGTRKIGTIRKSDVEGFLSERVKAGVGRGRIRQTRQLLHAVYRQQVEDGLLGRNPVSGVKVAPELDRTLVPFTPEEIRRLTSEVDDRYVALIYTLGVVGPRWGEAVALRRKHVGPDYSTFEIREAVTEVHGKLIYGPPKDHQMRTIIVPKFLRPLLAEHFDKYVAEDPDALVFTTETGRPVRGSNFRDNVWKPALEAVGLDPKRQIRDLRNSAISNALARGASTTATKEMVGHSKETMTLNVYRRIVPGEAEKLASVIDAAFNGTEWEQDSATRA